MINSKPWAAVLFTTAALKLWLVLKLPNIGVGYDPIFPFLSTNKVTVAASFVEVLAACILIAGSEQLRAKVLIFLGINFLLYHFIHEQIADVFTPCTCFGTFSFTYAAYIGWFTLSAIGIAGLMLADGIIKLRRL